ncbi:uncharacterized protein P884DRAFT_266540 [Thermothelomyces heterothallicus CBS 202.75]|uniref:uncharacterized protein n=1 Tax=Thermothelomyces heterothallicus CBS 202.75 TaxID=1149848 RepID=UPI0037434A25
MKLPHLLAIVFLLGCAMERTIDATALQSPRLYEPEAWILKGARPPATYIQAALCGISNNAAMMVISLREKQYALALSWASQWIPHRMMSLNYRHFNTMEVFTYLFETASEMKFCNY